LFVCIFLFPTKLHAREEAEFFNGEYKYIPYKRPTPTSIYTDSKQKTEDLYINALEKIFNNKSNTSSPTEQVSNSGQNPLTPANQPSITGFPGNTGSPGYLSSELAFATRVRDIIHANCTGGYVTRANISCLNNLVATLKNDTIAKLKYSTNKYYALQCVACADAIAFERGRPLSSGAGAAKQYLDLNLRGYRRVYNQGNNYFQLTPGSLFITQGGTYGHIGYVVEVAQDRSWFKAFECNAPRNGFVRIQMWDTSSPAGWQVPI